jgi:Tfp pilus assembly protein PilO
MSAKRFFYVLAGILVLMGLGITGGFYYAQRQLAANITSLNHLASEIEIENREKTRLESLQRNFRTIEPLAAKVQAILPAQKQQGEVVAQISQIVTSRGIPLTGLAFDTTKGLPNDKSQTQASKIGGIAVMPVKFQVDATSTQLQALLKALEQQERYMRVANLDITRSESNGKLTCDFTVEVFLKS